MDKWTAIILDMEDMWAKSAQYKHFPLNTSKEEYELERDLFKVRRIYDMYGYEYCMRFANEHPAVKAYLEDYVPCQREPHKHQCTIFCHKYNYERGCLKYDD